MESLDRLKQDFTRLVDNGTIFEDEQFEIVLDTSMTSTVELNGFAIDFIEKKNIMIENVLFLLDYGDKQMALSWSGHEHKQEFDNTNSHDNFIIYINDEINYKKLKSGTLKLNIIDCFIDFSKFDLKISLQTETFDDYNFINNNQQTLIYELPILKKYLFDNENFRINFNHIKLLNFKARIVIPNFSVDIFSFIPVKLAPYMDINILPPLSNEKPNKYKFLNKVLNHNNKKTIYFSENTCMAIKELCLNRIIQLTYGGKKYLLDDDVKILSSKLLTDTEICVNFMAVLTDQLQVAGMPGDVFFIDATEPDTKKDRVIEVSVDNDFTATIENPPFRVKIPVLKTGFNTLIESIRKLPELSKLRFEFLVEETRCIYFDTPTLHNMMQGNISLDVVINKYILGIDSGLSTLEKNSNKNNSMIELVQLLFTRLKSLKNNQNTVLIISCCDFLFKSSNSSSDFHEKNSKHDLTYLKWQKLFLEFDAILKFPVLMHFESEENIPKFFNLFYLINNNIQDLETDYKLEVNDYRDFLNLNKIEGKLKYIPLHQRQVTEEYSKNETNKPLYGMEKTVAKIKNIYETPYKYYRLFEKFPKMNKHMLLYGSPSMGKSLLIKHLPKKLDLGENVSWRYVNALSLISKYTGESERNVREMFSVARKKLSSKVSNKANNSNSRKAGEADKSANLSFIVIDNIQTLLPTRSSNSAITDRLVNTFLTELDGIDSGAENDGLVVIGVTNRPDLIDPAVVRPGRLENRIKIEYEDINWKKIIKFAFKDYLAQDFVEDSIIDNIQELIYKRKASVGVVLGSFYEISLNSENAAGLGRSEVVKLFGDHLRNETANFNIFENCFKKFDNLDDSVALEAVGLEAAFM
ncbi:hypothetical protein QEN19_003812 [Hanseniaspora menglaensis]